MQTFPATAFGRRYKDSATPSVPVGSDQNGGEAGAGRDVVSGGRFGR